MLEQYWFKYQYQKLLLAWFQTLDTRWLIIIVVFVFLSLKAIFVLKVTPRHNTLVWLHDVQLFLSQRKYCFIAYERKTLSTILGILTWWKLSWTYPQIQCRYCNVSKTSVSDLWQPWEVFFLVWFKFYRYNFNNLLVRNWMTKNTSTF